MSSLLDILSWVLLLGGGFLGISGAIGLFRFPDFYTRLHAASVTDTLCAGLIIAGLLLQATSAMMVFKLLLILFILTYTSPTGAHALAKAAMHGGLKPITDANKTKTSAARSKQPPGESPSTP
jgi:multicomponent Na+:H+ antiporter subunit G